MATIKLQDLVNETSVKFGTSGIRSLATDLTDKVCYLYTIAFINFIKAKYNFENKKIAISGDYRPSTKRIKKAVSKAISDSGFEIIDCGLIPTPAVSFFGFENKIISIMVTGSHIPDDRNGIKFNKPDSELLKKDESDLMAQDILFNEKLFDKKGNFIEQIFDNKIDNTAIEMYKSRYLTFFRGLITGKNIGVYGHSSVGRDVIAEVLEKLGAKVTKLGYSDTFVSVDTEAIRPEDIELAKNWASENKFDSIVSADGDADRPLVSDENGEWLRGDLAGILVSKFLNAEFVTTPVSSNTALEKSEFFKKIERTRIGSPYLVAAMQQAEISGLKNVVGYEANGGFLTQSKLSINGRILSPLPTRDALIVILSILALSVKENKAISKLNEDLPDRFTHSDRIKDFPTEKSLKLIEAFTNNTEKTKEFFGEVPTEINTLDGLRMTFPNEDIIHLRPSGNAPELRIYTESRTAQKAIEVNKEIVEKLLKINDQ